MSHRSALALLRRALLAAALSALAAGAVLAQGVESEPQLVDRIVAIVDEEMILQSDLEREIELYKLEREYAGQRVVESDAAIREEVLERLAGRIGEIGEIVVKGPAVSKAYYNRPEATALAKVAGADAVGFHHRMGDLGYLDEQGRLWMCGRKSHRVVAEHGTLFTVPCEAVFNTHPNVFRTALVGVGKSGIARPVLCVELERHAAGID